MTNEIMETAVCGCKIRQTAEGQFYCDWCPMHTAAPELLEALVQLREWIRHPGADDSPANEMVIDAADAAIAAATGD